MAITWEILGLNYTLQDPVALKANVVTSIEWLAVNTDRSGISTFREGTAPLAAPGSTFIAFEDITEANAFVWLYQIIDKSATESTLTTELNALLNPTTANGLPWL